jgi:ElaB/YqjD/DUF883 family membrane-anchored ribosome-binding protein
MAERTGVTSHGALNEAHQRTAESIRQDIAAKRESISGTVDRLGDRIQESLDWRSYVTEYPFIAVGLAAGVGFAFSGIFRRRVTPRDRILDAIAETVEDVTDRVRDNIDDVLHRKASFVMGTFMRRGVGGLAAGLCSTLIRSQANRILAERRSAQSPTSSAGEVESSFQSSTTAGSARS